MRPHVAGVKVHDGGPVGILGVSVVVHKYDDHYVVANVPLAFQLQKIRVVKRVCISIILSPVLVKRVKGQLNKTTHHCSTPNIQLQIYNAQGTIYKVWCELCKLFDLPLICVKLFHLVHALVQSGRIFRCSSVGVETINNKLLSYYWTTYDPDYACEYFKLEVLVAWEDRSVAIFSARNSYVLLFS